jgi:hypothetical protein
VEQDVKADRAATIARKFLCPKSYVTPDGREILFKEDWDARVEELRVRSGGRCEYVTEFEPRLGQKGTVKTRCSAEARDPHHVTLRSVLRDDRLEGLLAVCGFHHRVLDAQQRKAKIEAREARRA